MSFPVNKYGNRPELSRQIKAGDGQWFIPEEVPIAFVFNRRNYAVMMGTPDNLVDFALGFALTEDIVKSVEEIKSLDVHLSDKGADLRFKISNEALERLDITQRRRNIVGSASCGICGLENADILFKKLPRVSETEISLDEKAMKKAMKNVSAVQPLNLQTRSVHAAAWINLSGEIGLIREDVGRHNALDKLLGAMAIETTSVSEGFVLMSSRCSYEIVEKAARRGVKQFYQFPGQQHSRFVRQESPI